MAGKFVSMGLRWLLILAALLGASAASAQPASPAKAACHAYSGEAVTLAQASRLKWTCGDKGWRDGAAVSWLFFPASHRAEAPTQFASRMTVFRGIAIAALDANGTMRVRHYAPRDAHPVVDGAVFSLVLPLAHADTRGWLVRIDRPHSVTVASEARVGDGSLSYSSLIAIVVLALVTGMLVMPLLFDLNFYLVLRERFVLLHAAMVVAMIGYILCSGGLISAFVTIPVTILAITGPLTWAIGTGIGGLFIIDFLEPGTLPKPAERAVYYASWWAMIGPGFCALQLDATQSFDNTGYFLAYLPVIPTYCVAIAIALMRGSRSAGFLAVAWTPVIAASCARLLRGLGLTVGANSVDRGLFVALGIEVIIIALGVADRFLAVRRERDLALSEARSLEELSERDPLTGLFNRRALGDRFALFRAEGFTTLAVIDLDHFKQINDTHGHAVGDKVLKVVARVLTQDADTLAFRIGGEEFLLLLRGRDAVERAESRRRAISSRIAEEIEGLDRIVTASMGLIEVPAGSMPGAGLHELYDRADRLLNEAKQAGRNRTMSERLKLFVPRRSERRKAVA